MLESNAMNAAPGRRLPWLACLLLLAGCGHSRIVHRDYIDAAPASIARNHRAPARVLSHAAAEPIPDGAAYVVRRGETLYGISFRFGLRFQDVAAWNGIGEPYVIEVGQRLHLRPPPASTAIMPITPAQRASMAPALAASSGSSSVPPRAPASPGLVLPANREQQPTVAPATVATVVAAGVPAASAPVAAGGPIWRWPAQGQIVGRYVRGDQTQQGINIAGSAGQDVVAAADGVIVYSGAGLVGYGELIIVKHSDEWLSAYAHNRRRLVREGARVTAGQVIAEMGRTGAIRDMLHFEIRRNGKPVDPLAYLPQR